MRVPNDRLADVTTAERKICWLSGAQTWPDGKSTTNTSFYRFEYTLSTAKAAGAFRTDGVIRARYLEQMTLSGVYILEHRTGLVN